ncbi:hypothetical protein AB1Y20_002727 [Prymnesium parvum]|uniref:Uncharacterized protein n=1 Tax=Prymnesium parvum TaxID=97485 RepID=A0AB34J9Y6_PRYPA
MLTLPLLLDANLPNRTVMAYLFTLRRPRHPLFRSWNHYFDSCASGSFRIHLHVDPAFAAAVIYGNARDAQGVHFASARLVSNSSAIDRMDYSMVSARLRLLKDAVAAGGALFYQFLSESCAPVVSCAWAHGFVQSHRHASFVPSLDLAAWEKRYAADAKEMARVRLRDHTISPSDLRVSYSQGWVALNAPGAEAVLRLEPRYHDEFAHRNNTGLARWQLAQECPDVWYFATLLAIAGLPTWDRLQSLTYQTFEFADVGGHADMITANKIPNVSKAAETAKCLFARKFSTSLATDIALLHHLKGRS